MRKNGLRTVKKKLNMEGKSSRKSTIHRQFKLKLLNVKEVLKFDAKPQYEQHTLSIFLTHGQCQLLVQNILCDLQELFTEFLHNIPTGSEYSKG